MKRLALTLCLLLLAGGAGARELQPYGGPSLDDFALTDLNGKQQRLSELRGKVVLVNFWAVWCPPCVREMPSMQRLQERMAGRPFAVLTVNVGDEPASVQEFYTRMKLSLPVVFDKDGRVMQLWGVSTFPTSFVLDERGTIRYSLQGVTEWDKGSTLQKIDGMLPE